MIFKKAQLSDLDILCQIENESFNADSFAMSRRNFIYHIKKNPLFVCEHNGAVAGYILLFMRKNSSQARVYSLAVKKDFRGCGIAAFLIENIFLYSKRNAKKSIKLEVRFDNNTAINLYKRLGFLPKKIIKSYYPDNTYAFLMEKIF